MHRLTRRHFLAGTVGAAALSGISLAPAAAEQTGLPATPLEVFVSGTGQRVVFVHGSNSNGPMPRPRSAVS